MFNTQPIEKHLPSFEGLLDVHSIFKTIQGEGPFCGTPCVFVRLAGCNLQCPACDTIYTTGRQQMYINEIIGRVRSEWYGDHGYRKHGLVVITGGEPFRQHIRDLIDTLLECGWYVQVESNGTMNPPGENWNKNTFQRAGAYLVVSPKTPKLNPLALKEACALKYVVAFDMMSEDGLPLSALGMPNKPCRPPEGWTLPIYIQPLDSKDSAENAEHMRAAVQSSLDFGYILQLQVHKYIGVE